MPNFQLLTSSNPKTAKGVSSGFFTCILLLAPADNSGYEVCKWRTKGCTSLCLNTAGRGGVMKLGALTNKIQECRKRRTRLFFEHRTEFLRQLVADIDHAERYAAKRKLTPAIRLNGTSDLVWENIGPIERNGHKYANVFDAFPELQFYDYTKAPWSARRHDIPNYHLTFSLAETLKNRSDAKQWFANGANVSAVFGLNKSQALPATFDGMPVYDADKDDLRFLDSVHGIAGLRAKGNKWKHAPNNFVIDTNKQTEVLPNGK